MHGLSRAKIETTETQLFLLYYSANCSFSFAQVPFYHCLRCQQPEVFRSKMEDASVLLLEPNQMNHSQNSEILGLLFIILPLSPPSLPLSPSLSSLFALLTLLFQFQRKFVQHHLLWNQFIASALLQSSREERKQLCRLGIAPARRLDVLSPAPVASGQTLT